jgi:hypothetical protein
VSDPNTTLDASVLTRRIPQQQSPGSGPVEALPATGRITVFAPQQGSDRAGQLRRGVSSSAPMPWSDVHRQRPAR